MDPQMQKLLYSVIAAGFVIAGLWKIFNKAGRPGWPALVPIYNMFVLCEVCGLSGWFALLFMVPVLNIVTLIYLATRLGKAFAKGWGFILGIILLGVVFIPILGWDKSTYQGPPARWP